MQIGAGDETTAVNTAPRDVVSVRMLRRAETAFFWSLLITIALMALPLAGAHRWGPSLGAVAIGLSLFAYALCVIFAGGRIEVPMRRLWVPGALIALPVLWALLQAIPNPASSLVHPLWTSSSEVLHRSELGRISVDPHATGLALMRLLLYVAIFYMAVQLCRNSERALAALVGIVVIGTVHALYWPLAELLSGLSGAGNPDRADTGFDPHFVGLGFLAAIGLVAKLVHRPAVTSPDWRILGAALMRIARSTAWAPAAALLILLAIVMETHSLGELMAIGLGAVILLLCLISASKAGRLGYRVMAMLAIAGVLMAAGLAGQLLFGWGSSAPANGQAAVAVQTPIREALAAAPLLGHGYGTFDTAFPIYADAPHDGGVAAEVNGYQKLAFELGVPAAALLILAVAWVALRCLLGLYTRRRDIAYPALAAASAVATGGYALFGPGSAPALAALLALILGMGYSQSWATSEAVRITRRVRDAGENGVRSVERHQAGIAGPG